jgi:hypothetical protein
MQVNNPNSSNNIPISERRSEKGNTESINEQTEKRKVTKEQKEEFSMNYKKNLSYVNNLFNEKKEKAKFMETMSKNFDSLYLDLENFKENLPKQISIYLNGYLKLLEFYKLYSNLSLDSIEANIKENTLVIERIKQKFKID